MNSTVPKKADELTSADVQSIVMTLGSAFTQATASQSDAARANAEASIRMATINAETQRMQMQTDRLQMKFAAGLSLLTIVVVCGVLIASFITGQYAIVTHALASLLGIAAGVGFMKSRR